MHTCILILKCIYVCVTSFPDLKWKILYAYMHQCNRWNAAHVSKNQIWKTNKTCISVHKSVVNVFLYWFISTWKVNLFFLWINTSQSLLVWKTLDFRNQFQSKGTWNIVSLWYIHCTKFIGKEMHSTSDVYCCRELVDQ